MFNFGFPENCGYVNCDSSVEMVVQSRKLFMYDLTETEKLTLQGKVV